MNLDHVTIRTWDLQAARSFFLRVFDLEEGERPRAIQRIPGHWLYSEGRPLVHIIGSQGYGIDRAAEAIDHVGLRMEGYSEFRRKLDRARHPLLNDGPRRHPGAATVLSRARRPVAGSRLFRTRPPEQLNPQRRNVMSLKSKMPFQVWLLTLSAFAIGMAEFVIAGVLPQVAASLGVTEGQAGGLITAYALAIVIGGPILTLWLARFEKRAVLIGLMALFIIGNLIAASTSNYTVLLVSRVIAGLTQGPFFGIGAVVAMKLVSDKLAGQAVGQCSPV